jgi:hypothetical protein
VACGLSGHGFKFGPVVGEIIADLVTDGGTSHPIGPFDPRRLAPRPPRERTCNEPNGEPIGPRQVRQVRQVRRVLGQQPS